MSRSFRVNDAPDRDIVQLSLSFKQMRLLDKLVNAETFDVECMHSDVCEKTLHSISDALWKHLHIRLTPEEQKAASKPYFDAVRAGNEAFNEAIAASRNGGQHD